MRKESERQRRQRFVRFFHTFQTDCLLVLSLTLLVARAPTAQSSATADQVLAQAQQTYAEQGGREALPVFERALALYRDTHDRMARPLSWAILATATSRCRTIRGRSATFAGR